MAKNLHAMTSKSGFDTFQRLQDAGGRIVTTAFPVATSAMSKPCLSREFGLC
jgi:hypothetical protein